MLIINLKNKNRKSQRDILRINIIILFINYAFMLIINLKK